MEKKSLMRRRQMTKQVILLFTFLCFFSVSFQSIASVQKQTDTNWYDVIMERVQTRHKAVHVTNTDNTTAGFLSTLQADGSFADINYNDQSQTNWSPLTHLDRMKYVVLSYTISTSRYYNDDTAYNAIVKMFEYWYQKHPLSSNWYNQQIACPQRVGVMLILMRSGVRQLPADLENNLLSRMATEGGRPDQSGSQGTGANKLDIATHWVYRGCLTQDDSVLSFGAEQVYYPLFLTTGEGLQHDYSYHQHGNQIHIGSYGFTFVDGISSIATYMTGTPYEMSAEKLGYLSRFVREGYLPTIRGQYFMFNVLGRAVARKNGLNQSGFHTILTRMKEMDPANTAEYDQGIARVKATESAGYGITPANRHYWRSDYTLHQRPGYAFDMRGSSIYSARNENGNGENIKGYFLADGATELVINGNEFVDIFSVWDWARVPGTTTPIKAAIPQPAQWQTLGTSTFSGTASDGVYGVSTYLYNDANYTINTSAKKAWFMFDDEIVCLGASIKSTAAEVINTTLNQTLLNGDVWVKTASAETSLAKGSYNYSNPSWIYHNGVGYVFPKGGDVFVQNNAQSGSWYSINTTQSNATESKDVFKLWLNHGVKPTNGSYEYILVPNKTKAEVNAYSNTAVDIVYNTDSIQAVKHNTLGIIGIVFYKAATFKLGDIQVKADRPCAVLLKNLNSTQVEAYVSDPSRTQTAVKLRTIFPAISGQSELTCTLPKTPDAYAGATKAYIIDEYTPKVQDVTYDKVYAVADAWVRDGSSANQNVGGSSSLVVKKDADGYNREAYVKFDLTGVDPASYDKYLLKLTVSNANTSIDQTQWNISYVSNNNWAENTITWNNRPVSDLLVATAPTVTTGCDLIVDLTSIVAQQLNNGNTVITFHISSTERGSDGKTDAQFYSKETGGTNNSPQMLLQRKEEDAPIVAIFNLPAVADSWVRDGSAYENVNYGTTTSLTVKKDGLGYNRDAYLKFNLSSAEPNAVVGKATLRLSVSYANTSIKDINWQLISTDTNWSENTITYNTRPTSYDVVASAQGQEAGTDVYFDVSQYVKEQFGRGIKDISFMLVAETKSADGKSDAQFFSKESSTSTKHPLLEVGFTKYELPTVEIVDPEEPGLIVDPGVSPMSMSMPVTPVIAPSVLSSGTSFTATLMNGGTNLKVSVMSLATGSLVKTVRGNVVDTYGLSAGTYIVQIQDLDNLQTYSSTIIVK